jgi:Chloramphenicol phosphotransferase-like protein
VGQVVILSGPPRAGKTSTAKALCARYDRMAHIDVGALAEIIRMGRLRPDDKSNEGRAQRGLLVSIACDMAERFIRAGYGVIIEDVVLTDDLPRYEESLEDLEALVHAIALLPEPSALSSRAGPATQSRDVPDIGRIRSEMEGMGIARLDPGSRSPEEVADAVMELAARGDALLIRSYRD